MKKWLLLSKSKPKKKEELIEVLLANRGIKTKKEKEDYLNPLTDGLSLERSGLDKKELDKAVKRIKTAIQKKEPVIVYTDYDVDGVASGTIVWETLFSLGADVLPYVPHRVEEGYGLSVKGIDKISKDNKVKLIITVDHGVTAREKVEYAKKLGIDVIILDHHTLPEKLPKSVALIHTTKLCATGVAWFFANYLSPTKNIFRNLDLVSLATIADLIPLAGINRILVKYGLIELNKTKRIGLLALIKASGLIPGSLGVYEVGHMLAPRINASGRLTHGLDSLRLLCTKDEVRAEELAGKLSSTNRDRQVLLEETVIHARDNLKLKDINLKLIFIAEESYNQGIIGLVAGKLAEEYYRPAIIISKGDKYSKASARSILGFNIVEAIRSCSDLLIDVGGHPMAAGFTVETEKLILFEDRMVEIADKMLTEEIMQRSLKIDCLIDLDMVDPDLYKHIKMLEPFGIGNPTPVFASHNVKVVKMRLIGKENNHLKITLQPDPKYNQYISAIGFGMGKFFNDYDIGKPIDIAYTIDEDNWNRNRNWSGLQSGLQLKLKDVKFPQ